MLKAGIFAIKILPVTPEAKSRSTPKIEPSRLPIGQELV